MAEDTAPQGTPPHGTPLEMGGDDTEDMEAVADRLEAALERIARHLEAARTAPASAELVARVDGLIVRLRDVLGPHDPARD